MNKIFISGATIIPVTGPDEIIRNGEILIEGDAIAAIGPAGSIAGGAQADKVIDGREKLIIPGFVNGHTHAAMTLLRSYADDLPLMDWLNNEIWPVEEHLIAEDIYWGTMLSIAEMIKSGTTTFADMYFHMDQVAKAAEETGIRAVLSRGMVGSGPNGQMALSENRQLAADWHQKADGRITVMFGPHAPYTCTPEYLKEVRALATEMGIGINIHLAETLSEVAEITEKYGKTPVELMDEIGLFDGGLVVGAHCVHVTDHEISILAEKGVGVVHNPESNMKLASGVAPVPKMLAQGIKVGLGTDGASSNNNLDMLQEMRTAALLHKLSSMDATVLPAYQALEMATAGGAAVLGLDRVTGRLEPGYKADLLLLDMEKPHLYPRHDVVANLVYSAQASDIETVIVNGIILMEAGKLTTINEKEVLRKTQEHTDNLLFRSKKG